MAVDWRKLIASIALCELAGAVGSLFAFQAIPTWYASLAKPFFAPPNWIFAPVWIALYALMGVSLYLVWSIGLEKRGVKTALLVFGIQLFLNALWPILFFGLRSPFLGLICIALLWLSIAATIYYFEHLSKKAAWLLAPYFLWVSFAALLNYSVWLLNA